MAALGALATVAHGRSDLSLFTNEPNRLLQEDVVFLLRSLHLKIEILKIVLRVLSTQPFRLLTDLMQINESGSQRLLLDLALSHSPKLLLRHGLHLLALIEVVLAT